MFSPEEVYYATWAIRVGERVAMSILVVTGCVVYTVLFYKAFQTIRLKVGEGENALGISIVLSMPIFLLLTLILYAYVTLSNPISISRDQAVGAEVTETTASNETTSSSSTFSAFGAAGPTDALMELQLIEQIEKNLVKANQATTVPERAALLREVATLMLVEKRALLNIAYGSDFVLACGEADPTTLEEDCQKVQEWLKLPDF
ncbi:MAG: hypothetical protein AAGC81_04690 [Pseudomonadota bacterium]